VFYIVAMVVCCWRNILVIQMYVWVLQMFLVKPC